MREWTLTSPGKIELGADVRKLFAMVMRGSIRVLGTDSPNASLEVSEIDDCPLFVQVDDDGGLKVTNGQLNARRIAASALRRGKGYRAVVSIAVPRECAAELYSAVASSVVVAGLRGRVRANVGEGELVLGQLSGPVDADNSSGSVSAMEVSGPLTLKTVSGEVTIAGARGSVRAETVSGPLTLYATPGVGTHLQLATATGAIRVGLPNVRDCTVELASEHGAITSQFPEIAVGDRGEIKESLGMALWQLWARTSAGNITLVKHVPADA